MALEVQTVIASNGYNAQQAQSANSAKAKGEAEQVAVKNQYKVDGEETKVKTFYGAEEGGSTSSQSTLSQSGVLALQSVEESGFNNKKPTPSEILRAYNSAGVSKDAA